MKNLIDYLESLYPYYLQESYDFCGYQIGKIKTNIKKVLICLDYEKEVEEFANEFEPDLILTHHPFFFGNKEEIVLNDPIKRELAYNIVKNLNCAIYSFHTCFDNSDKGMNDLLAQKLELNSRYIHPFCQGMHIGYLAKPLEFSEFAKYVKKKLDVSYLLAVKGHNRPISKVGIIGGGGASLYKFAAMENLDCYISGDFSHHLRREIYYSNLDYFDIPHEVERIFIYHMKKVINEFDSNIEIMLVDNQKEAKVY